MKFLAIGMVLLLPILFYIIFSPLGRVQRPKVPPKLFAQGVLNSLDEQGQKMTDSVYHTIPNFKLETQSGDSMELDSLRGSIYVADFFFASCPGICPKLSHSLERVQAEFIKDRDFKIVSFTVDPERDSLPQLRKYAYEHNAVPGRWYFLRTSPKAVYQLAANGFFVTAKPDPDNGKEAFVHSEKLVLVDGDGHIRGYYSGIDSNSVNKLMGDIVLLLRNRDKRFSFKDQGKQTKKLFNN